MSDTPRDRHLSDIIATYNDPRVVGRVAALGEALVYINPTTTAPLILIKTGVRDTDWKSPTVLATDGVTALNAALDTSNTDQNTLDADRDALFLRTKYLYAVAKPTIHMEVDFEGLTALPVLSALLDAVIRAKATGVGGNAFTFATVADGTGIGSMTLVGSAYTFHFQSGVTTLGNLETAVTASANLEVKTAGTTATLLVAGEDEFAATALSGGGVGVKAELDLAAASATSSDTTANARANALKVAWNGHLAGHGSLTSDGEHKAADSANVVATADASDLTTRIALINALLASIIGHGNQAGVHFTNDAGSGGTAAAITTDPPVTRADCLTDLNDLKQAMQTHMSAGSF